LRQCHRFAKQCAACFLIVLQKPFYVGKPYNRIEICRIEFDGTITTVLREGKLTQTFSNAYERNAKARASCLKHHGFNCAVCGFNFGARYGAVGEGYIHVHHPKPLSQIGEEHQVDPVQDLRPVCPNCHAMLHTQTPPLSIEELKEMLR
jgi:5-methylcytosine-specific restriction protein A